MSFNQQRRDDKKHYKVYFFQVVNNKIKSITQCQSNDQMYVRNKSGFYRRVNVSTSHALSSRVRTAEMFEDTFQLDFQNSQQNPGKRFKPRRLYNVYENQDSIFKNFQQHQQSFIDYQNYYSSFATQLALLDKFMLQAIFFTRNISKNGLYQYFIRRNGEYYLEQMDDVIPVDGKHQQPIWGFSYNCPWQLLLMKAWMKQKGGLKAILNAQPGQFLYAFGLPGYSVKNIKRQVQFLAHDNTTDPSITLKKEQKLAINKSQFNIFGKTRSKERIQELGLIKNCLGYKVTPIHPSRSLVSGHKSKDRTIYKVKSTIPSKWVGSLSIVSGSQSFKDYNFKLHTLNLQKQFLCTEEQVLSIFSKFYLARDVMACYFNDNRCRIYQDSYVIDDAYQDIPYVFKLNVQEDGFLNLNIQHKDGCKRFDGDKVRWPYIKYFLAKADQHGSNIKSRIQHEHGIPGQFQPNLFKYKYYDIEFVKGYHRSVNRFMQIQKGQYYIYIKMQKLKKSVPRVDYTINISSSAKFDQMMKIQMDPFQLRQLIDSTIFDYSKIHGQKYVRSSSQYIYMGNSFRQIGFGFMALEIKQPNAIQLSKMNQKSKAKINPKDQQLGIRIFPGKMKKLKLAGYYYQQKDGKKSKLQQNKQPISMISGLGYPKIIVLQDPEYTFKITQQFPQPDTIQVYSMVKKAEKSFK